MMTLLSTKFGDFMLVFLSKIFVSTYSMEKHTVELPS